MTVLPDTKTARDLVKITKYYMENPEFKLVSIKETKYYKQKEIKIKY